MTKKQIKNLHSGDEVFWNDPDEGKCSRTYLIQSIEVDGDIVIIQDQDGSNLECFADELE